MYLNKAENQKKLNEFKNDMRKLEIRERHEPSADALVSTKEGCLEYSRKLWEKIERPKAELLIRQARNMKQEEVPRSVFAHRAQIELQMHQLKAYDELYLETGEGVEYEDYVKKSEEFKTEQSPEYKAIEEASKDRMRAIIQQAAEPKKDK